MICRVVKECLPKELLATLMLSYVKLVLLGAWDGHDNASEPGSSSRPVALTEYGVGVLQALLDAKVELGGAAAGVVGAPTLCAALVQCLQAAALQPAMGGSLKFSKLVFTFVSKHKAAAAPYQQALAEVVGSLKTFMKKAAAKAVDKLSSV